MIAEVREALRDIVKPAGWDVYTFLPDDVNRVPCVVVGQLSMDVDAQLYAATAPVYVVGRRLGDEDSQSELDNTVDRVVELLGMYGQQVAVTHFEPVARVIAGQSYPAYRIDVAVGFSIC